MNRNLAQVLIVRPTQWRPDFDHVRSPILHVPAPIALDLLDTIVVGPISADGVLTWLSEATTAVPLGQLDLTDSLPGRPPHIPDHDRFEGWSVTSDQMVDLLESIAEGSKTAHRVVELVTTAMLAALPEGACCLRCIEQQERFDEARLLREHNDARRGDARLFSYVVAGRDVHTAQCRKLPLPEPEIGSTLAEFTHGVGQSWATVRDIDPENLPRYLNGDEMHRWATRRMGPGTTGTRPKLCRSCKPRLPEKLSTEP